MKKTLVLGGLAAVCIPALAFGQAGVDKYAGEFEDQPGSLIKLKVDFTGGQGTVTEIKAKRFGLTCKDGSVGLQGAATLGGEIPVRSTGSFKVADRNGKTTFKTRATVRARKIEGTFRFFGKIDGDDGVTHDCDSGPLSFTAKIE